MEDYWTNYNTEGNAAATNGETVTEAYANATSNGNDAVNEDDFDIDMTL